MILQADKGKRGGEFGHREEKVEDMAVGWGRLVALDTGGPSS